MNSITSSATNHPSLHMRLAAIFSAIMIALVAAPSLAPGTFDFLQPLKIDTDPENMLAADEPVRVFHNEMKAEFTLHDLIVVGVVNTAHKEGVFNAETLGEIHALAEYAETIRWKAENDDTEQQGVIAIDIIAPSTVDSIEQAGLGSVRFNWLLPAPPTSDEEALAVRERAQRIPTLNDTLVSGDGTAIALYIPITSKDVSFRVAKALRSKIAEFEGDAVFHITGLPIAQDQFGVEMFKQMAISAPAAMALIFALMWLFFRRLDLIVSPMIVAMVSVIGAMGLLVATGNTVHIMSSMIPIFVMPIAVLDAVHILSDFYDRYPAIKDRRKTLDHVMGELWQPMLFTTLTTCTGFASLAFTPIPPVQVFGIFVAIGVFFAWFFTVTLIPAYIMLMPEKAFSGFGMGAKGEDADHETTPLARFLHSVGEVAVTRSKIIVSIFLIALAIAGYGVTQIRINDNPVKWFGPDHDIRVADRALNERFGGTYMAYLALSAPESDDASAIAVEIDNRLAALDTQAARTLAEEARERQTKFNTGDEFVAALRASGERARDDADADDDWYAWDDALLAVDAALQSRDIFKRPDVLRYIEKLQRHLGETGLVGKSNAVTDIVKTVHRDLFLGEEEAFRIPDTPEAVAQTLITFQNSHRPQDLFKLVTPDYRKAVVWLQLKSGDNVDMSAVIAAVERYVAANPPPTVIDHDWFGLTYINVAWQQKMVSGMARAFLGSFVIVLILMTLLFRSFAWGLLSMAPLTVTIGVIYGVIGLIGKDYDMPVAVLSSLSLGLAIDYAIHFNARSRQIYRELGDWASTAKAAFGEPARAIFRNVIVIGVGFLPLLLAPLVPYQTVGAFISAILVLAGVATLLGLPALITIFQPILFPKRSEV